MPPRINSNFSRGNWMNRLTGNLLEGGGYIGPDGSIQEPESAPESPAPQPTYGLPSNPNSGQPSYQPAYQPPPQPAYQPQPATQPQPYRLPRPPGYDEATQYFGQQSPEDQAAIRATWQSYSVPGANGPRQVYSGRQLMDWYNNAMAAGGPGATLGDIMESPAPVPQDELAYWNQYGGR